VGLVIIAGSAELTVTSATDMAVRFGVEQSLIAILLIGLGSSLPELAISVVAAFKRRAHLSIGNLIGSNIFDTLVPIGAAAMISGLTFDAAMLRFELPLLFVLSVIVLLFFKTHDGIRKAEAWASSASISFTPRSSSRRCKIGSSNKQFCVLRTGTSSRKIGKILGS